MENMKSTFHEDAFLDANSLAERWKISVKTLRNRRATGGDVVFLKIGRSVRYRLSDVLEFEQNNLRESTSTRCV